MRKITFLLLVLCVGLTTAQEFNYSIHKIDVNTKYSDFGVSYFGENEAVFASARKPKTVRTGLWNSNRQPYLELYIGKISENGEIDSIRRFSKKISTKYHESNVAFTKDLQTVYFSRNNYLKKKYTNDNEGTNLIQMYKAHVGEDGEWTDVQAMPFNDDNYQTGHPVLNKEENKLYFTSDMPGSIGATDIFFVDINEDGTYGTPKNLGPNVNTVKKEMFPFIDDNNVLYFSSDGYFQGRGGLDIYAINILDLNSKVKPKNLGFPINSNEDDFSLVFRSGKREGHFSSNRKGGKGDDDIYYFKELVPIQLDCNQIVNGVVRERITNALLPGAKVDLYNSKGQVIESVIADSSAKFTFNVNCNESYKVVGSKFDYNEDSEQFITNADQSLDLTLGLNLKESEFVRIRGLLMIAINPIYFDLDKSVIRFDAAIELEKVARIMRKYPMLKIELGSHTDSRAPDQYNWSLSERRAKASLAWLIKRGVNASKISGKGYGETQLVNKCSNDVECSEAEHQLNRRTEFIILNPEAIK
ncbi:OmpA family protein [Polaribacter sp. PL03]|uniref:OmpA family protein n=1 Tax=Polaribacter sp. PL03 TaxID=3088353 RepID=UPI0029D37E34|nr:OmpA family protein [Polaribacter sp. PL03]MDX6746908.1 OmpA family protein [Polaribacter sp. PL03]